MRQLPITDQSELDAAATLINLGMLDKQQFLQRVQRGEPIAQAADNSRMGRWVGDFHRFIGDWKQFPQTTKAFAKLVRENPTAVPGMMAQGMVQAGKQLVTQPGEQPFQTISDLATLLTLGAGGIGIAGRVGGAVARTGVVAGRAAAGGRLAQAVQVTGGLAEAAARTVGRFPRTFVALDLTATFSDPQDPLGMVFTAAALPSYWATARQLHLRQQQPAPPEPEAAPTEGVSFTPSTDTQRSRLAQLARESIVAADEVRATDSETAGRIDAEITQRLNFYLNNMEGLGQRATDEVITVMEQGLEKLRQGRDPAEGVEYIAADVEATVRQQQSPAEPLTPSERESAKRNLGLTDSVLDSPLALPNNVREALAEFEQRGQPVPYGEPYTPGRAQTPVQPDIAEPELRPLADVGRIGPETRPREAVVVPEDIITTTRPPEVVSLYTQLFDANTTAELAPLYQSAADLRVQSPALFTDDLFTEFTQAINSRWDQLETNPTRLNQLVSGDLAATASEDIGRIRRLETQTLLAQPRDRVSAERAFRDVWGLDEYESARHADVLEARAAAYAATEGVPTQQWYEARLQAIERQPYAPLPNIRAQIRFLDDGRAIITAFQRADASSAMEEISHLLRRDLRGQDLATVESYFNVQNGRWTVTQEEAFAKVHTRYLRERVAPTPRLRGPLEKLRQWALGIYRRLANHPEIDISPELRLVFDRQLGGGDVTGIIGPRPRPPQAPRVLYQTVRTRTNQPHKPWLARISDLTFDLTHAHQDVFNSYAFEKLKHYGRSALNELTAGMTAMRRSSKTKGEALIEVLRKVGESTRIATNRHDLRFRKLLDPNGGVTQTIRDIHRYEPDVNSRAQADARYKHWLKRYLEFGETLMPERYLGHFREFKLEWMETLRQMLPELRALDANLRERGFGGIKVTKMSTGETKLWNQAEIASEGLDRLDEARRDPSILDSFKVYWPHMFDTKALQTAAGIAENIDLQNRIQSQLRGIYEADATKFGSFERMRESKEADGYEMDPRKVVGRYIHETYRRMMESYVFGQRNELLNSGFLKDIYEFAETEKDIAIRNLRSTIVDVTRGNYGRKKRAEAEKQGGHTPEELDAIERRAWAKVDPQGIEALQSIHNPTNSDAVNAAIQRWARQPQTRGSDDPGSSLSLARMERFQSTEIPGFDYIQWLRENGYLTDFTRNGEARVRIDPKAIPEIMVWQAKAEQRLSHSRDVVIHHQHWQRGDPYLDDQKRFMRFVDTIPTVTLLGPTYLMFNFIEAGLLPAKTGLKAWLKSARDFVSDPEVAQYGSHLGSSFTNAVFDLADGNAWSHNLASSYLRGIKGLAIEQFVRAWGANAAFYAITDGLEKALAGTGKVRTRGEAWLQELGVNLPRIKKIMATHGLAPEGIFEALPIIRERVAQGGASITVPRRGELNNGELFDPAVQQGFDDLDGWYAELASEVNAGAFRTSQEVFKEYNSLSLPRLYERGRQHPLLRSIFKFKGWILQQNRLQLATWKRAGLEAKNGNWGPMGRLIESYTILGLGGMAATAGLNLVYGRTKRDESKAQQLLGALIQTGSFGLAGDLFRMAQQSNWNRYGTEQNLAYWILGPTGGIGVRWGGAVAEAISGELGALGEQAVRSIPFAGPVVAGQLREEESAGVLRRGVRPTVERGVTR